jgi:two-component system capsular synthesis response regulator RcsB
MPPWRIRLMPGDATRNTSRHRWQAIPPSALTVLQRLPAHSPYLFDNPMKATHPQRIRVATLDSHAVVRFAIAECLCKQTDLCIVGSYATGNESLRGLLAVPADVMLLEVDSHAGDIQGVELIGLLKRLFPELNLVVLSTHDDLASISQALHAGARGYVHKRMALDEMAQAVRSVAKGQTYVRIGPG